jgi:deoxycytidine triphosphate deaminase
MFLSRSAILTRLADIIVQENESDNSSEDNEYLKNIERRVQECHLELCVGEQIFVTTDKFPRSLNKKEEFIVIPSGEFALLTTYEVIRIPKDLMAFISIRFRYKVLGLVNISGFHVDPLFQGKIVFSVFNIGPSDIVLKWKEPVFTPHSPYKKSKSLISEGA